MDPGNRLTTLTAEIAAAQTELQILDEQLAFLDDVAEDARLRALMAETPLADREAREARDDAQRMRRNRDDTAARIGALRAEQDALLDRMFEAAERAGRRDQ